ncbi:MAG: hypothetical protein AB7V13_23755 [Pseudorhodoplanes sp.]|uniref:hypothetical protein n=1 Tax=Pseudorhodoplanes sp. TaxID=1934341 RepID=UPI003D113958
MTRTERAMRAMVTALQASADADGSALPSVVLRNEDLLSRMDESHSDGVRRYLNVWDGDGAVSDETLGADLVETIEDDDDEDAALGGAYQIEHRPRIELICEGGTQDAREAAFDAALREIHDVLRGSVLEGERHYLGGAVDWSGIESIARAGSGLVTDGVANVKACEITVLLEFTSARPF